MVKSLRTFVITSNALQPSRDEQDEGDFPPPSSGIPPPDYSPTTIGPPVYQDALQDVILSSGTSEPNLELCLDACIFHIAS